MPPLTASTKLKPLPRLAGWANAEVHLAELTATAGLFLVTMVRVRLADDCLEIGDLRDVSVHFQLVAVLQALLDDIQVKVAHAGNDQLVSLRVAANRECRVFVGDLGQAGGDLGFVVASLGLHGPRHHGNRKLDGLDAELGNDGVATDVADRIRDVEIVELGDGNDIAGDGFGDLFLLFSLHHVDVACLGGLAAAEVDNGRVVGQPAAQDSQIAQLTHELVVDRLEDLRDQGALLGRKDFLFGAIGRFAARAEAVDIGGRETAGGDQVEQLLEAQFFARADAQDGHELALRDRVVRSPSELVRGDRFAFEVAHHQFFVELDDLLDDHAIGFRRVRRGRGRGLHHGTG